MSLLQSIWMGLIQGLTEFLPVSSSGHLAIFKILAGVNTDTGILFDVLLHVGTLAAVVAAYYKDVWRLIIEFFEIIGDLCYNLVMFFARFRNKGGQYRKIICSSYRKFVVLIIVSTIPTVIIGYLLRNIVEVAEMILLIPGCCLLITAGILLLSDLAQEGHKKPKTATYGNAIVIGICQGIATLPGISRSGMTITSCVLSGFDRKFAVKYSFILSIPAIIGAMVLEIGETSSASITAPQVLIYIVGMVIAAVVGYICIKLMVAIVTRKLFKFFAIYCAVIGIIAIVGYMRMV
ncbi:MAG: undecaprenyl-diphosphate phosphatase [Lachnospiraceae bacterium]|nr:undecaprenyl-diphosphate phosphatase [Lachnospiraceae bacterium]